jgi:uncharacterized protein YggU (UPF0235/DUF167 family)
MPARPPEPYRLAVRVRPGASRTQVGGRHGDSADPTSPLVVAVSARAVDGAATQAVLVAVAKALGVRPRQVTLVRGATSRDKLLEISDPPDDLPARIAALREPAD